MSEENKTIDVDFHKFKGPVVTIIVIAILLLIALSILVSGFYTIDNGETGVVLRFGTVIKIERSAGFHFKIPVIEEVRKVKTSTVYKMEYGYRTLTAGNTQTGATYSDVNEEAMVIVEADENNASIAMLNLIIQYKISDPANYLFKVDDVEGTIRLALEDTIRKILQTFSLDEARTQKELVDSQIQLLLVEKLDKYNVGIEIITVKTQNVELLPSVQEAYRQKEDANQYKNSKAEEAEKYSNSIIPIAEAEAQKLIQEANGYSAERLANARAAVAEFNALYEEYLNNPEILKEKYYIEAMTAFFANNKVIMDVSNNGDIYKFYNMDDDNLVKSNIIN